MLNDKVAKQIMDRLGGSKVNFLRDAKLFGLNHAIREFHLESLPFNNIYDWAQSQTDDKILSLRGVLSNPEGGTRYMEDFLEVVLNRFANLDKNISELQQENERLRLALAYHRSHPLDNTKEMMEKVIDGNANNR
jgi:hypothetical protein